MKHLNGGKWTVRKCLLIVRGAFEENTKKLSLFSRMKIRFIRRSIIIGKKPYPKNMKTSKVFVISEKRDFKIEKLRLIKGIERVQELDINYFLNRSHPVFGKIGEQQWNIFFTKHLDHHLRQFGV